MRSGIYTSVPDDVGFEKRGLFVESVGSCPTYKKSVRMCSLCVLSLWVSIEADGMMQWGCWGLWVLFDGLLYRDRSGEV